MSSLAARVFGSHTDPPDTQARRKHVPSGKARAIAEQEAAKKAEKARRTVAKKPRGNNVVEGSEDENVEPTQAASISTQLVEPAKAKKNQNVFLIARTSTVPPPPGPRQNIQNPTDTLSQHPAGKTKPQKVAESNNDDSDAAGGIADPNYFIEQEAREREEEEDEEEDEFEEDEQNDEVKSVTRKRTPPANTSSAAIVITKQAKTGDGTSTRERQKLGNYAGTERALLKLAQSLYRCAISCIDAFPDHKAETDYAYEAWTDACSARKVAVELDADALKLITDRGWSLRGELKQISRPIVESMYVLKKLDPKKQKAVRQMREKVEDLLHDVAFMYKDPGTRKGLYLHPVILKLICRMWFNDKNDEGVQYSDFFKPGIPLPAIALVLTVIENILEEFKNGTFVAKAFTEKEYGRRYQQNVTDLCKWAETKPDFVEKWQRRLLVIARGKVGLAENEDPAPARVPVAALQKAAEDVDDADLDDLDGVDNEAEGDGAGDV